MDPTLLCDELSECSTHFPSNNLHAKLRLHTHTYTHYKYIAKASLEAGWLILANEVSIRGSMGRLCQTAAKLDRDLQIRASSWSFFVGDVPCGNWVTVGSRFPPGPPWSPPCLKNYVPVAEGNAPLAVKVMCGHTQPVLAGNGTLPQSWPKKYSPLSLAIYMQSGLSNCRFTIPFGWSSWETETDRGKESRVQSSWPKTIPLPFSPPKQCGERLYSATEL